jgi:hypothetical protein
MVCGAERTRNQKNESNEGQTMMARRGAPVFCLVPALRVRLAGLLLASCLPLSCATAPAIPAANPAAVPAAAAPPAPKRVTSNVICHPGAHQAVFAELGVPGDERPVDLAMAGPYVYVLFEPARLLRVKPPGAGESGVQVQMQIGRGETWKAMDVDPRDGSLWIASDHFVLRHMSPQGAASSVPLQRVAGEGGFSQLLAAPDALYAAPACADEGVWRLDRQGKILGSAFPYDPEQDAAAAREPGSPGLRAVGRCGRAYLMHGRGGAVLARDFRGAVRAADGQGNWRPVEDPIFAPPAGGALTGVDVGGASERWYFTGGRQLFYWKDRPAFLGSWTMNARTGKGGRPLADTVVVVPGPGSAGDFRELIEDCQGQHIVRVATTADRYAAITGLRLIYGELAAAPDLP